ncbi:YceH family protein [Rubellicoccus peritrichatus]|uniref:YceH family protein n=1 Tax=Rubellicoccus peritrichatus TaxID=3080537 RepID=A0AAQ3L8P7_9BACT|nr:YceH family protein [Puniceicoccus sp. CR14]WOO39984.1 YceH family protein [Puniceicoccus sp. CR14]
MEAPSLSSVEIRVLGCLIEKESTTPENYPLTLNSLVNACNQKSSRDPVLELEEDEVLDALDSLREKRLVYRVDTAGSRVAKYRYDLDSVDQFNLPQKALLCVLCLRGPQTPGELRTRTERLHSFANPNAVLEALKTLQEDFEEPLVTQLPRQAGRKEARFAHLLGDQQQTSYPNEVEAGETDNDGTASTNHELQGVAQPSLREQLLIQQSQIDALNSRLNDLSEEFARFRAQFD